MKAIVVLLFVVGVWSASHFRFEGMTNSQLRSEFITFQQKYHKVYQTNEEFEKRFEIFKANLIEAARLQKLNPLAIFGVTKFSDLTPAEFGQNFVPNHSIPKPSIPTGALPNCKPNAVTWDWGECGVITPVYNQGQCGSAYMFAAIETIESYCALAGAELQQYSVQQLIDCCSSEDQGCSGGSPQEAFQCVINMGGIETWQTYPYISEDGENCIYNKNDSVNCLVTGIVGITGEDGIYEQVSSATGGPVAVCVDAATWASYVGGILTQCGNALDHCVQLTGYSNYGQSSASWSLRNSWGSDWGENGYIQIAIGQDLCGVGNDAAIVTVTVKSD